jgi:hypothetical protein
MIMFGLPAPCRRGRQDHPDDPQAQQRADEAEDLHQGVRWGRRRGDEATRNCDPISAAELIECGTTMQLPSRDEFVLGGFVTDLCNRMCNSQEVVQQLDVGFQPSVSR